MLCSLFIVLLVATVWTIAWLWTGHSYVKTFTVFLLTLWFLTVACTICMSVSGTALEFKLVLCHFNLFSMNLLIVTTVTSTIGSAHFTGGKTLTVHFETVCLFTCTTALWIFFLFWCWVRLSLRLIFDKKP